MESFMLSAPFGIPKNILFCASFLEKIVFESHLILQKVKFPSAVVINRWSSVCAFLY